MIRKYWILILILGVGIFLRAYHPLQLFQYDHDHDLTGWFIRDVLINHHIRLIGQETSSHGIFIGPYFYYLQIPFYLLTRLDPAGSLLLPILLSAFAIVSVNFTFRKMFNAATANIASLIYGLSTLIVFTDREVVPTMPVMLWTIWFLFAINCVLKNKKNAYLIIGFLFGLIWSLNLQLVILFPIILLAQYLSGKRVRIKELLIGIAIAAILNIPFAAFEVRHGFQQTRALISSLTTSKDYVAGTATGFLPKLDRTMQIVYKNSTNIFGGNVLNINPMIIFWLLTAIFGFLVYKKKINRKVGLLLFLWQATYILFFTKISLNISEYYLNGMNIIYILVFACGVNALIEHKKKFIAYFLIAIFVASNLYSFFTKPVNANGYLERKAVIEYIKNDAIKHNYPCVSLSFIVSPGNDLGYRYFTWELGLKTKKISNEVPVYSIVFPLSMVDGFDKSFGALGVVLPDYKRYNDDIVQRFCQGEDYTTAQPMFGFTN